MDPAVDSQDVINQREWESSWNWSASGFYSSRADSRLWVPKRPGTGSGQALNMGHRRAKVVVAGVLIAPVTILVAVVLLVLYAK